MIIITPGQDAITTDSLEGGRGFEEIPDKETLLAAVLDCSFTKNNRETGEVCDRIQVSIKRKHNTIILYIMVRYKE